MAGSAISNATGGSGAAERSKRSGRRATIRDAAARVFAVRGYHGASVQEVADELGINKATLYHYYTSKEQMLFEILTFADEEVSDLLESEVRLGDRGLTLIGRVVAVHVTWYLQHPAIARVSFRDWNELSGDALTEQIERRRRYSHFLRNAIEICRDEGVISPETNVGLVANFINGAVAATNVWFDPEGADTPEQVGQAFGKMAVAIILAAG